MTETDKAAWFGIAKESGFGEWTDADDYLHPLPAGNGLGEGLSETQFFGWNIPEENITGLGLLWHRPNLKVASVGVWAWQGVKNHNLKCEIYDWYEFASDEVLAGDLHDFTFPNGYRSQVLKPFQEHHVSYSDPSHHNAIDVHYEAIRPPVVPAGGKNFEQLMRTSGQVTLRGKTYPVNGMTIRDRNWQQVRPLVSIPGPPMTWTSGYFGDGDLHFCLTSTDTPSMNPEWKDWAPMADEDAMRCGWIHRDGKTLELTRLRKLTRRNKRTLYPEGCELHMVDSEGAEHTFIGTVKAAANLRPWHNTDMVICLMEWSYDGRIGHGDFQDVTGADYLREYLP